MSEQTYPVATIAKLLILTERQVQSLAKDGVLPKAERGRYALVPVVQAYKLGARMNAFTVGHGGAALDYDAAGHGRQRHARRRRSRHRSLHFLQISTDDAIRMRRQASLNN